MLYTSYVNAQFAEFSVEQLSPAENKSNREFQAMQWILNGQPLSYALPSVKIIPNPDKIDTLLFKAKPAAKWDTIYCNIKEAGKYQFTYNECCGGFDLRNQSNNMREIGEVAFKINNPGNKAYLGTLGESGLILSQKVKEVKVKPACRSAMSPNIYHVTLQEVVICSDTLGCENDICLYKENQDDQDYNFWYKPISVKANFLYMPLGDSPLVVVYDPKKGKVSLR